VLPWSSLKIDCKPLPDIAKTRGISQPGYCAIISGESDEQPFTRRRRPRRSW
jgi:hypothetical protein